jgi:hypothetical protein
MAKIEMTPFQKAQWKILWNAFDKRYATKTIDWDGPCGQFSTLKKMCAKSGFDVSDKKWKELDKNFYKWYVNAYAPEWTAQKEWLEANIFRMANSTKSAPKSGRSRGFAFLKNQTVLKVDASAINQVVLTLDSGVEVIIDAEESHHGIPVIKLSVKGA